MEVRDGGGLLGGDAGRYRAVAREFGVPSLHRLGNRASDNLSLPTILFRLTRRGPHSMDVAAYPF